VTAIESYAPPSFPVALRAAELFNEETWVTPVEETWVAPVFVRHTRLWIRRAGRDGQQDPGNKITDANMYAKQS
jgi:hypothetical protein